ncbi:hypothetical protein GCM10027187_40460 [Streptosporangium sandarakinum]|uniref:Uncharacterized protein n=1 Tax=Streptosporangium sandarakinum TaxID=1260955 RepID=A0A852VBL3_9ACTN|nr:hypothetical protein [Streptosporangium sandarakinum]NYF44623.1 hypothetical protein [Streptosporangium sandarakinum]
MASRDVPGDSREACAGRHPAGRGLVGRFTQTHPWLAEPDGRAESDGPGGGEVVELRARVEDLERRLASLERPEPYDGVEVVSLDGRRSRRLRW